jgi:poly-beta-1,6-N-acetyl-D-glucosamine synthase
MKWIFWGSAAMIGYAYFGYAGWLWVRSRLRRRPIARASCTPTVSILMVVRNEERNLDRKLRNLQALEYPAEKLEFAIVSDGSTDATSQILAQHAGDRRFRIISLPQSRGKAYGLNEALRVASGEVIVFTDARQEIEPGALQLLVENFADPAVGCASGELMLGDVGSGEVRKGMGLYWRVEKKVRELESCSGSVIGATGAFYAARRELIPAVPPDTILDDVYIPMEIARQGKRVVFDPRAQAWDSPNLGGRREFSRKVRTLSGNYQLLQLSPWLLSSRNPLRFEFVSHKLVRLVVPFALMAVLVSSGVISGIFFKLCFYGQLAGYGLAAVAQTRLPLGPLARIADAASTIVVLNTAALLAFFNFVGGRKVSWTPIPAPATAAPSNGSQQEVGS